MHSLSIASKQDLTLVNKISIRLLMSAVLGAIVTFALFAFMHYLVKQDTQVIVDPPSINWVSSVLSIDETKTQKSAKPKPLPELVKVPQTIDLVPQEPNNEASIGDVVEIVVPKTALKKFTIGAIDQQPRPRVRISPSYPSTAASRGIEGFVELSFSVSSSGKVEDIKIINSEPRNVFDKVAKQALKKWRYQPKMVAGEAVGMEGLQIRLDFNLNKNN